MARFALLLPSVLLVACGATGPQLSRSGLTDDRYALHVASVATGVFVSDDWLVDNLVDPSSEGSVRRKEGDAWEAVYRFDVNGDGIEDEFREHAYVLRLRHRTNAGVLWSSVMPLPRTMERTELRVLARLWVEAASRDTVTLSVTDDRRVEVEGRRLATRTVSEGPVAVRGYEGYRVEFEVADVDQAQLTPNASWQRREVVLVRPGFVWLAHRVVPAPGLLVLGHANLPEDFTTTHEDFTRFVAAVDFREDELGESRRALSACAPDAELVGVARTNDLPARYAAYGAEGAGECFARTHPAHEPNVSFGVRREPFAPPATPATEPASPTMEPASPTQPTSTSAEESVGGIEPAAP